MNASPETPNGHLARIYDRHVETRPHHAAPASAPLSDMDFSHETPFTAVSLKQALEFAGFGGVNVAPMGPVINGAKSALRFLLWKGIAAGLRFVQTVEGRPRSPLDSIYTAAIYAIGKSVRKSGGRLPAECRSLLPEELARERLKCLP